MHIHNNLRFKSILSKWTDFCGLWPTGGVGWAYIEDGGGEGRAEEGICPEVQGGI